MGFPFHVTTMFAGEELTMHYQNHLEAVLVLKGTGTIEDLATGEVHKLRPGVMYALNDHDRHIVRPATDLFTPCLFTPPVTAPQLHPANRPYPSPSALSPPPCLPPPPPSFPSLPSFLPSPPPLPSFSPLSSP